MKKYIPLLFTLLLVISCISREDSTKSKTSKESEMPEQLRHIVLFKFKEAATSADIQKVELAFVALPSKIKEIKDFEWGINNSPEGLNKDFTHCFLVTFDSEKERAIYLPHPAHLAFVNLLSQHIEDVLVLDYWAK